MQSIQKSFLVGLLSITVLQGMDQDQNKKFLSELHNNSRVKSLKEMCINSLGKSDKQNPFATTISLPIDLVRNIIQKEIFSSTLLHEDKPSTEWSENRGWMKSACAAYKWHRI